jgi:hypothetical protein
MRHRRRPARCRPRDWQPQSVAGKTAPLSNQLQQRATAGPCGDFGSCDLSAAASSGSMASHSAFNSESASRLSFIRSSRMATDTNSEVSRSRLSISAARHCSGLQAPNAVVVLN